MKWHLSFYWLLWVVPAFFIVPTCAKASGFVVEVALNHIDVTVGFSGASIQVFGDRRDKDAEVAIVVMGPKKDITIWQKARVMGTWVNRYFVKFRDMPMYYNYALSAKNVDDAMQTLMSDNVIGNDSLFLRPDLDGAEGKKTALFKDALLRKKLLLVFSLKTLCL